MVASRARHRRWDFLEGMVSWLKGEPTDEMQISSELPPASIIFDKKVASRLRWEAVRSLVKVQGQQRW